MVNLRKRFDKGVTLVELLVAITISAIVIVMAINIYISTKKIYQKTKSKTELDVKELTTKKILYDAVIDAGFSCKYGAKNQVYTNKTGENPLNFNFMYDSSPVRVGKISDIAPFLTDSLGFETKGSVYQVNTDYIMVKNEDVFTELSSRPINLSLYLDSVDQLDKGDYLALCNNDDVNIVKIDSVSDRKVELNIAPSSEYHKNDYAGKYSIQIFYIAANQSKENPENVNYSLFMYTKSGSHKGVTYPVIDGVSDLKISYSILNRKNLSWRDITRNTDLDDIEAKAIKVSFKLKGKLFEKVILL
ncbi:N-terminal cleavage protein [Candidatus Francisella endociliophora]|uniref:N-terminal cleavage protein n=1 Tax=Candidatus Francisella endociliophora TaxID=653937 RepID=A0A097EQN8_9GAMM|nr:prepilin-type N-terminal cleavage/methylation domain-containing protein [Francisella sp. FSC1006]AIT09883.1 N-terminal cleavage protein [Francisella sp. FSC1006]